MTTFFNSSFFNFLNDATTIDNLKYFLVLRNIALTVVTVIVTILLLVGVYFLFMELIDTIIGWFKFKYFKHKVDKLTKIVLDNEDIIKLMKTKGTRKYQFNEVIDGLVDDKYLYRVTDNVWHIYKYSRK
jgi:hypothetical protein